MMFWDCYTVVHRTARKEHRCFWCYGTIQPGQEYRHTSGILDGRPHVQKWCKRCEMCMDGEEGDYMRPEDALESVLHQGIYHREIEFDGRTLVMHGHEQTPRKATPALFMAHIVPGTGLTDWTVVASGRDLSLEGDMYKNEVRHE